MNKVKQPKPDISDEGSSSANKKFKIPYIGVINTPKPSLTPVSDTILLKRKEKPHIVYKLETKQNKFSSFDNVLSIGVIISGIMAIYSLLKGKK